MNNNNQKENEILKIVISNPVIFTYSKAPGCQMFQSLAFLHASYLCLLQSLLLHLRLMSDSFCANSAQLESEIASFFETNENTPAKAIIDLQQ